MMTCSLTHSLILLAMLCALNCIHCEYKPLLANKTMYTGVVRGNSLLINRPVCYPGVTGNGTAFLYVFTSENVSSPHCEGNNRSVDFTACTETTEIKNMVFTIDKLTQNTDYRLRYGVPQSAKPCSGLSDTFRTKKVEPLNGIVTWLGRRSASMVVITSILAILLALLLIAFILMFFVKWETPSSGIIQQVRPQQSQNSKYSKYDTHHFNGAYEDPSLQYVKT
uniref:Uncharacterized protein n=1 Tax=Eptatretus burgeri TaxID=7764 RepID=A0A8C4QGI2_EPTBU